MADGRQKRLLAIFRQLPEGQKADLLSYAEFLGQRHVQAAATEIVDIPRPAEERLIDAIKRLRSTYPMLDPGDLLPETSELVNQHLLAGRDAAEVIDELESLFLSHYENFRKSRPGE